MHASRFGLPPHALDALHHQTAEIAESLTGGNLFSEAGAAA